MPVPKRILGRGYWRQTVQVSKGLATKEKMHLPESLSRGKRALMMGRRILSNFFNPNKTEWLHYRKFISAIPKPWSHHFVRIRRVKGNGHYHYFFRVVKDYTGEISKPLKESGPVSNALFWQRFGELVHWLNANRIFMYDWNPGNVMVKWISPTECIPVLVDYKLIGPRSMPEKPWLVVPSLSSKFVWKRFEQRMRAYRVSAQSPKTPARPSHQVRPDRK